MTHEPPLPARIGQDLRQYGAAFGALGRVFAERLGLHTSDASALVAVIEAEERGEPISAARLAGRIGLTAAATSSLLNRLEAAGHVVRMRDGADRRVVTLRSTEAVHQRVDAFFAPLGQRLDALLAGYPPEVLQQVDALLRDVTAALDEHGRAEG